jgi:phytoene/squalene synthetase
VDPLAGPPSDPLASWLSAAVVQDWSWRNCQLLVSFNILRGTQYKLIAVIREQRWGSNEAGPIFHHFGRAMPFRVREGGDDDAALAYCLGELRREDRDRYLTLLFAPKAQRVVLAGLYAFNLECARAVTAGGEQPLLGQMRLQWWRDALEAPSEKPTQPVLAILASRPELTPELRQLLAARERDLTDPPFATLADVTIHAQDTGGALAALAAAALGGGHGAAARAAGTAYALAGMLRAIPHQAPGRGFQGRLCLPLDMLASAGLSPDDVWTGRNIAAVSACVRGIAAAAALELAKLRDLRGVGPALSPLLHGSLASAYLKRLAKAGFDPFSPHLALPPLSRPLLLCWRALLRRP